MLITVSRQFASGGSQVARRVAAALDFKLVDDEFVRQVAERAGLPEEEVAQREERAPSFLERLAQLTASELPDLFLPMPGVPKQMSEENLVQITRGLVNELAAEGRCILVGRASAAVLGDREGTLDIRLVAPFEFRTRKATELLEIPEASAAEVVEERDSARQRYHQQFYDRDANDAVHYDLVLNTERLGFDGAAEVVVDRARQLGWIDETR